MPELIQTCLSRAEALARVREEVVDLLVIGGGIVGAGVARDGAMRGLSTALVEAQDFAFGTSSRSSRLLHGGLRYLAQGRIGLVREASTEKMILHRIAPHLAEPLAFVFPTYRGTQWKRWKLRLGVKVYDWLCGKRNLGKSQSLTREEVRWRIGGLNREGLTGAVRYFDGLTNDARLVMDTLRSAAGHGTALLNYVKLISAERREGVWHCEVEDALKGERLMVRARSVVNAAGAWANRFPQSRVKLRLTKGIHLVIERSRLNVPDAVVMTEGPRILFAIPWGQRVILGTTDTDYEGPTESPDCGEGDIEYVLGIVNRTFPEAKIGREDVVSWWSGLRPLIARANGKPSDISRAHRIEMTEPGWFDVAGGKLTTYRLMAEQTVDRVARHRGTNVKPSETAGHALVTAGVGGAYSGILPPPVLREAVAHFCRNEWAQHLDDVMVRRTSWRYYHRDHVEIAERVSRWMSEECGWTEARREAELARYRRMTEAPSSQWEPGSALLHIKGAPRQDSAAANHV